MAWAGSPRSLLALGVGCIVALLLSAAAPYLLSGSWLPSFQPPLLRAAFRGDLPSVLSILREQRNAGSSEVRDAWNNTAMHVSTAEDCLPACRPPARCCSGLTASRAPDCAALLQWAVKDSHPDTLAIVDALMVCCSLTAARGGGLAD